MGACAWLAAPTLEAAGQPGSLPGKPVTSVFFIAKSENRNQVHYAVRVDDQCRPVGNKPVYNYWRDFEKGPGVTSPLLDREQSAYGLTEPHWVRRSDQGGRIRIGLRSFPERPLIIETFQGPNECRARALVMIQNKPAVLRSIYVDIGFLFNVDYILLRGYRVTDNRPVQEKIDR